MGLKKCTRCELNYILDDHTLCTVCREEVQGKRTEGGAAALCSVCGELPAIPGEDMCRLCLTEIRANDMHSVAEDDEAMEDTDIKPDDAASFEEMDTAAHEEPQDDDQLLEEDVFEEDAFAEDDAYDDEDEQDMA